MCKIIRMKQPLYYLVFLLLAVSGCSSSSDEPSSLSLALSTPDRVALAVDNDALSVSVTVDGQPYPLNRGINGSQWVGNFALPTDRDLELSVQWFYDNLLVARYTTSLDPITEPVRLELTSEQYVTTGIEFDKDSDGSSNLAEIQAGTNPVDADNIDIVIPRIGPNDGIGINGQTGATWARFRSFEWNSNLPAIDNLMIDRGTLRKDGATEFYWQAAHNGTSLFIIVYGESVDRGLASPIRDSRTATRDDAVRLFFDGNNSKLNSYDGVDDLFITTPLLANRRPADDSLLLLPPVVSDDGDYIFDERRYILMGDPAAPSYIEPAATQGNDIDLPNTEWVLGPPGQAPSVNLDGFDFSHSPNSQGTQVYEFKFPLAGLGIRVGQPFGFEVQIDSDHNGGNSDARYGWKHPSKGTNTEDINYTEQNPSYLGTVVLEE